ncbi:MAG: glycosyltransferase family 39 protein [Verrucomicrobiota bacterium]
MHSTPVHERPQVGHLLLLFIGFTLLFCLGNGTLPLIDRDEPRFAEASREMLQTGDWIVPHFNAAPRYDKPPLIYWMQIACYRALGSAGEAGAFAARLPAVLCTALSTVLLACWGARMGGRLLGLRAAIIYGLCVQVFVHGRAAVADPPMVLFTIAAAWAGWEWLQAPRRAALALTFWISLALGFLAKGPIAWVPVGMVGWSFWRARKTAVDTQDKAPGALAWIFGSALMLGIVALWGIPALLSTQGEFASVGLGEHVVGRSLVSMEGHGAKNLLGYIATLPLYFITVFPGFAPWSFWLPAALRFHWHNRTPSKVYLGSGVLITFTIFTLSRTKLPHYTLPCFPFLALLLADWWEEHRSAKLWRDVAIATTLVFTVAPLVLFGPIQGLSVSEAMTKALAPVIKPDTAVALVDYREPSLVWGVRGIVTGYAEMIGEESVSDWLAQPGARVCILTEEALSKIPGNWEQTRATGWNFAKGKKITLIALRPKGR